MVLGTRSAGLPAQLDGIRDLALHIETVPATALLEHRDIVAKRFAQLPKHGLVVVALDPSSPAEPTSSAAVVAALADAISPHARSFDGVFVSGGETARAVLDRLGVSQLDVIAEIEAGTVVSTEAFGTGSVNATSGTTKARAGEGLVIVTRPGSYGGPDSLRRCASSLLANVDPEPAGPAAPPTPTPTPTPNDHAHHLEENP